MTKRISLSRGKVALVDDSDWEDIARFKWSASVGKSGGFYAVHQIGGIPTKMVRMHRIIMNAQEGQDVDHINGDTLDNRRENLRISTRSENLRNRGKQKDNTSGYKGVTWSKKERKWKAQIKLNRKVMNLGTFHSAIDAARAYDAAARNLHGEFAHPNFQE